MKKVLGAALIGSLALGALTADPKFTLNYRMRANAFQHTSVKTDVSGVGDSTVSNTNWFSIDKANSDSTSYANAVDNLGIKIDNDNYGVQFQMNASAESGSKGFDNLNTYNAWMKFEDAGLTIRSGTWKDGYADGNYRVKKMIDAAAMEGIDGEAVKLGGLFKGTNTDFIDNMAAFSGSDVKNLAFLLEYGLDLDDAMSLNFLVGLVSKSDYNKKIDTDDSTDESYTRFYSGPVARIQLKMKELLNAELIYKNGGVKEHAFGLYVMPDFDGIAGLPLTLNVGGAMGFTTEVAGDQDSDMEMESWEIDLRALYQVNDQLSIHTMNGLANYVAKGGLDYTVGAELNKAVATGANTKNVSMALWDMIGARYVVSDSLAVGGNVAFLFPLAPGKNNNGDKLTDPGMQFRITPYVQVYAAKNAALTIGSSYSMATDKNAAGKKTSYSAIAVPVVFRVKC